MSGLEERLRKAVGAHLPLDPHHLTPAFTRDAIVAACRVLAEEFGPRPEDAAPPVRELPTEPGAVVLADLVRGVEFDRPILLVRSTAAQFQGRGMWYSPTELVGGQYGERWHRDAHVTQWDPAVVVPARIHEAAVKALRDVVELLNGPQSGDVQEAQDAAINALAFIDGEAAK